MDKDSFGRELRAFSQRSPFVPFEVELITGVRIEVRHPEALMSHNGMAVYFRPDGEISLFDHHSVSQFLGPATPASS